MKLQDKIYTHRQAIISKAETQPVDQLTTTALKNAEARATKILNSPEAIGREDAASAMAAEPKLSADQVIAILKNTKRSVQATTAANRPNYKF